MNITDKNNIIQELKCLTTFKYVEKEKLKTSGYYIKCLKDEIGKIAFENQIDITISDVNSIVKELLV